MHILHYNLTTTTKYGGVETFVWEAAREQAGRGHQVTLIGGAGAIRQQIAGVRVLQAPYLDRMGFRRVPGLGRMYALTKLLERASMVPAALPLLPRQGGIAHLHKPYDLLLAPWLQRLGYRVVLHHHGEDFFGGDRLLVRYVDLHLSCSAWNGSVVQQRYGLAPEVVYNGVAVDHFAPRAADPALRAQLALPGEQLLLYVGRLIPWKGIQDIIAALALLSCPARLLIVGEGPYQQPLHEQVAALGLAGRVSFLGPVAHRDLPELYRLADVVVGASFASETFGMTLAEALACGRPVVATRFGGFPEVVEDAVCGLLVPPRNPEALARALLALLADEQRRVAMGAAGRQRVVELFSWPAVTDRLLRAYARIV